MWVVKGTAMVKGTQIYLEKTQQNTDTFISDSVYGLLVFNAWVKNQKA